MSLWGVWGVMGSFLEPLGASFFEPLGSFWDHFGSLGDHFESLWGSFWEPWGVLGWLFGPLGPDKSYIPLYKPLGSIPGAYFWDLKSPKWSKMVPQREPKWSKNRSKVWSKKDAQKDRKKEAPESTRTCLGPQKPSKFIVLLYYYYLFFFLILIFSYWLLYD